MSHIELDDAHIKELFKQALVELLEERRDLFYDLVVEVLDDLGLLRAIEEDEDAKAVVLEMVRGRLH